MAYNFSKADYLFVDFMGCLFMIENPFNSNIRQTVLDVLAVKDSLEKFSSCLECFCISNPHLAETRFRVLAGGGLKGLQIAYRRHTCELYSLDETSPPDYPILGSNFTECRPIMLYPLVGTLHDECCQGVLLVEEYRVFGGE